MNNPLVTIIIPVYKVEKYLHRCIDSVLNQTYTNLSVILVDDGSPDDCPLICDEYAARDKRVSVIHKQNGGQSSARNAALDCPLADAGLFTFFLDSDDFLHPQAMEILLRIQQECQADMVQCYFMRGTEDVYPQIALDYSYNMYDNTTIFHSDEMSLCVCGGLYKSWIWKDIRFPLGTVNEDDATSWQAYFKSQKIAITKLPLYYYYINTESTMWRQRKNLRLDFINHYHNRINFFREKRMVLHTQLSQWRFCLPLMMNYVSSSVATKEQLASMWSEYKENVRDVLRCPKVPFSHKCLFVLFRCLPKTSRFCHLLFMFIVNTNSDAKI